MSELTKEQLSEKINDALGLDIDFSKISKKDLLALSNGLAEKQESAMHSDFLRRPLRELLGKKMVDKEIGDLTVLELLQQVFQFPKRQGGGLLGFGLLPINLEPIRNRRKKS